MYSQWRRFQFFDHCEIPEHDASDLSLDIACCSFGGGFIIFGDRQGTIHFMKRNFKIDSSYRAYDLSVTHLQRIESRKVLISIGDDNDARGVVKIWKLDKSDKFGNPFCCKIIRILPPKSPGFIQCFSAMEDLSHIAVGLNNGTGSAVLLYHGDILNDRGLPKQRIIRQDGQQDVTGLGFSSNLLNNFIFLFVVKPNTVITYRFSSTGSASEHVEVVDEVGAALHCSAMSTENIMFVGRNDGVFEIGVDTRGACYGFEGEKKHLSWFHNYLLVVSIDAQNPSVNILTIYDVKNKLVAFSMKVEDVHLVVCEWSEVFVLTSTRKLFQLTEKDAQTKLELLYKKNLYPIALSLAESGKQFDPNIQHEIHINYGDHLYSKNDYEGAMAQYIQVIDKLEPSYVIRKYLDAQRINNLTKFLEILHEKSLANSKHTTLLLNCYTKLKNISKLDDFIKKENNKNFDVETAIKVCRQASYHEHALYLAKKHNEHDWYLKIQLEDVKNYGEALDHITKLSRRDREQYLKRYGKVLLRAMPNKTNEVLMDLFINKKNDESNNIINGSTTVESAPEDFIHIFVGQPVELQTYLECIIAVYPETSSIVWDTLLELYLRDHDLTANNAAGDLMKDREVKAKNHDKALQLLKNPSARYDEDHALVLVQMHDFKPGMLQLYEKLKRYKEMLEHYMEADDYEKILRTCKKHGGDVDDLWVMALSYFASKDEDCHREIMEVLVNIERQKLLPPLLVVQILSSNSKVTLSAVSDYITRQLQQERHKINEDQRFIREYKEKTMRMKQEIDDLQTKATIFQNSKCSECTRELELPTVHFLCRHSYHANCLLMDEQECPKCSEARRKAVERKDNLEKKANNYDKFIKELEASHAADAFSTAAEYFGKGVFGK